MVVEVMLFTYKALLAFINLFNHLPVLEDIQSRLVPIIWLGEIEAHKGYDPPKIRRMLAMGSKFKTQSFGLLGWAPLTPSFSKPLPFILDINLASCAQIRGCMAKLRGNTVGPRNNRS